MAPPFSSTSYDIINIGSAEIVNRSIRGIDIELATIDISNLSASCIASLSGGGGGLTANSVDSSHIVNRTILGIDISLGQIGEAHFDASFTTQLEEFGDAIKELQKLQGILGIRNATTYDQDFSYTLSYKHPTTGALTEFASYTNLSYTITASHFFKLPSLTHLIRIAVSNAGGVSVEGTNGVYGGGIYDSDGNNIDWEITDVNALIEINVAI
jgi:hypothetical protein